MTIKVNGGRTIFNITTDSLTTIFTGACTACLIWIGTFLWNLKERVPKIEQRLETVDKKIDDVQGSVNGLSQRFTILSNEQIRQKTILEDIKTKNQ